MISVPIYVNNVVIGSADISEGSIQVTFIKSAAANKVGRILNQGLLINWPVALQKPMGRHATKDDEGNDQA